VKGNTSFDGLLIKRNLMLDHSIGNLIAKRHFTSPGKAFGGPRFP
jgi:hypothetical protein